MITSSKEPNMKPIKLFRTVPLLILSISALTSCAYKDQATATSNPTPTHHIYDRCKDLSRKITFNRQDTPDSQIEAARLIHLYRKSGCDKQKNAAIENSIKIAEAIKNKKIAAKKDEHSNA